MSERSKVEEPDVFMSQVAAVSWAATQTPETTLANQSPKKTRLFSANHTEVFCVISLATPLLILSRKNICTNARRVWISEAIALTTPNHTIALNLESISPQDRWRQYRNEAGRHQSSFREKKTKRIRGTRTWGQDSKFPSKSETIPN
jgi:hypothetical protein